MIRPTSIASQAQTETQLSSRARRSVPQPSPAKLSADEKQAIDSFFPGSKRVELRLYGPARPVGPGASSIGSLLDLKG